MGIIELIKQVGEDNVLVQPMMDAVTNASLSKSGVTTLTIKTNAIKPNDLISDRPSKIGLIVWIDRVKLVEAGIVKHSSGDKCGNVAPPAS